MQDKVYVDTSSLILLNKNKGPTSAGPLKFRINFESVLIPKWYIHFKAKIASHIEYTHTTSRFIHWTIL